MKKKFTWVVTDGKAGMIAQARGLAEAVGLPIIDKIIVPSLPWRWLPAGLWSHSFLDGIAGAPKIGNPIAPPWPDLLVSCGRNAVGPALAVKRNSHGHTLIVHVQHPRVNPARFDIVAAPAHDNLSGANVMTIQGALHRATPERLAAAAKEVASTVSHLSRPLVAVLIGGSNRSYRLTPQTISKLADNLVKLTREHDVGLMVTPSRRTGSNNEEILRQKLAALPAVIWDKMGDNPYYGYLGLADAIIVTPDSVNMVSEACSTGKPVYIAEMEGSDKKFQRFHQALFDAGMTRPFVGALEAWQYTALDDITPVAIAVRHRLNLA
jgi:mitochondrial fission protein ELM1